MKKAFIILGVLAIITSSCNKSDTPGPHSSNTPCSEEDYRADMRTSKPGCNEKIVPQSGNTDRRIISDSARVQTDTLKRPIPFNVF